MAEQLKTVDGAPLDPKEAARAFHAAMAAPEPDEPLAKGPPRQPHWLNPDGSPKYGLKADGTIRRAVPGPGKAPKARVDTNPAKAPDTKATTKTTGPKDYTQDLTGLVQLTWGVLAVSSPADAGAVKHAGPGMVQAWNAAAQENATVAKGIEWLTKGGVWGAVLMATSPLILQVTANHMSPAKTDGFVRQYAGLGVKDPVVLAAETQDDLEEMSRSMEAAA